MATEHINLREQPVSIALTSPLLVLARAIKR